LKHYVVDLYKGRHGRDPVTNALFDKLAGAPEQVVFFKSVFSFSSQLHDSLKVSLFDLQVGEVGVLQRKALAA
jgi:hypothetical protein